MSPEQVTLGTAILGAVTGTTALLLQLLQYRADRPNLKISAHMSNSVDAQHPVECVIFAIDAVNHGRPIIRLKHAGIELPPREGPLPDGVFEEKSHLSIFDAERSGRVVELDEGDKFRFISDPFPQEIAEKFREREIAFVEDTRGKRYKVKFHAIKPEHLPKNATDCKV